MNIVKKSSEHIGAFIKWILALLVIGITGGVVGVAFHKSIDYVTEIRHSAPYLVYLLPVGGVVIAFLYNLFHSCGKLNTDRIIEAVKEEKDVPVVIVPLIFIASCITHLMGGSAGREGAALQLGGGIGYKFGKLFKLNSKNVKVAVMSGMSGVFSALFGTPLAASVFALEVTRTKETYSVGLVSCVITSLIAYTISVCFGVSPVRFSGVVFGDISAIKLSKILVLSAICAVVSILFCASVKRGEKAFETVIPNNYMRGFIGGAILVLLTVISGTYDYNGAGMNVIERAISGQARYEAFILKIIFTSVTVAAGFKGGEIVPALFIGSTLGCILGSPLGLDPTVSAAVGFVVLFCGAVNCPIASLLFSLEIFGVEGLVFFALSIFVCYIISKDRGLYKNELKTREFSVDKLDK